MKNYSFDSVVIGSGAAGFGTACRITEIGKKSVCIVTEGITQCFFLLHIVSEVPLPAYRMKGDASMSLRHAK